MEIATSLLSFTGFLIFSFINPTLRSTIIPDKNFRVKTLGEHSALSPTPGPSSAPVPAPSPPSPPSPPVPPPSPPEPSVPLARLQNLTVSGGGRLIPEFSDSVFNYSAVFGPYASRFTFTVYYPRKQDNYLAILYNEPLLSGIPSRVVEFERGKASNFDILVFAVNHKPVHYHLVASRGYISRGFLAVHSNLEKISITLGLVSFVWYLIQLFEEVTGGE